MENADEIGMNSLQRGHASDYIYGLSKKAGESSNFKFPNSVTFEDIRAYREHSGYAPYSYDMIKQLVS